MNFARILNKGLFVITTRYLARNRGEARATVIQISRQFSSKSEFLWSSKPCLPSKVTHGQLGILNLAYRLAHDESCTTPAELQIKKRPARKKRNVETAVPSEGTFNVSAFTTAEEYNLEALFIGLMDQGLYTAKKFFSTDNLGTEQDVLYVTAKYKIDDEPRDIFFFREGSIVLWNVAEIETNNILSFLKQYEKECYIKSLVIGESEVMPYAYVTKIQEQPDNCPSLFKDGTFYLTSGDQHFLQKYTYSNAIATSIKLGMWEATLERYINSIEFLTEDLRKGRKIRISRQEVLRKTGELFALRHHINLSSDLLDTPDFYWDREDLEQLYLKVCSYFSISRRTKVMNEKINHCLELAELISHNLNDVHHCRLEWMIIILIMVEVGFEILHYMDRIYGESHSVSSNSEIITSHK